MLAGLTSVSIWIMLKFNVYGKEGSEVRQIMKYMNFIIFLRNWSGIFGNFIHTSLKTAGATKMVRNFYTFPYMVIPLGSYIVGIYFGFGAVGIFGNGSILLIFMVMCLNSFMSEEKYIEFIKGL